MEDARSSGRLYNFNHQDAHAGCPEKIIICVDLAKEVETMSVKSKDKGDIPLLVVWKNALELFVWNKNAMNPDHEFALIVLTRGADWFCSFSKDANLVCRAINQLQATGENYDTFDLASLYSIIYENSPPPPATDPLLPPPYTVRVLFLYCRSNSPPIFKGDPTGHNELLASPYFFLDVLYAHQTPSPLNMCEHIFYILSEQYTGPKALVLDWSFNVTKLFNYFASMLAHPLQRPVQDSMDPKLLG
ncbi:hypothetical protein EMCRGX_G013417 [Ephydatia muelleri]|eukprot:Em0004g1068a